MMNDSNWRTVELPAVRLNLLDGGGDGPPVVCLHSLALTAASWLPQARALRKAGFRPILYDRRGWGESRPVGPDQPGTGAADLLVLLDSLDLSRVHVAAVAGGAFVAIDFAAMHPDRVSTLTLAATTGGFQDAQIQGFLDRIRNPLVPWPSIWLEVGLSHIGTDPEGLARWEAQHAVARQPGADPQPLATPNVLAKLANLTMPVMAIAGGADQIAPPALMHMWTRHLPNCRFEVIAEAGHSINWENPQEFNALLIDFLGQRSSSHGQ